MARIELDSQYKLEAWPLAVLLVRSLEGEVLGERAGRGGFGS